ncbi:hypothetical protein AB834_02930 [PVC group bacterium (ex Bugula neritina AB1)]|nr:hypothetical protein AB834_02930 [PVC group bacterium (ex Bugula neritina AB1)]
MELIKFKNIEKNLKEFDNVVVSFYFKEVLIELNLSLEKFHEKGYLIGKGDASMMKKIPLGKTMSSLFYGKNGIFGFHVFCDRIVKKNENMNVFFKSNEMGWKVEKESQKILQVQKNFLYSKENIKNSLFNDMAYLNEGFLRNISLMGATVQVDENLEIGDYIYILLSLDYDISIKSKCVIVSSFKNDWSANDCSNNYGIRFVDASKNDLKNIEKFIVSRH